jgi:hypothetical protein
MQMNKMVSEISYPLQREIKEKNMSISKSLPNQLGIHLFLAKQKKIVLQQFGIQLGKF